ncbi:hypothetical protein ACFP2T_16380 [Plantactinospora solaniradicis]|uniref:Uncharacterized protein n=1 Tax=Plantactinospora solaniradicis TaxID=1723736 RepID=A0ABW1KAE1_9ACTN
MTQIVDQPPPAPNDRPSVQSLVRSDLEVRERVGVARYGTPLQPHNGRDALVDAYQEVLDLACYLRQAIEEHDSLRAFVDWVSRLDQPAPEPGEELARRGLTVDRVAAAARRTLGAAS